MTVRPEDLRIETVTAGDSWVRVTHVPTGEVESVDATEIGRVAACKAAVGIIEARLAIATVVDEAQEALDAWRAERCKCPTPRCEHATWAETAGELVQAAAVALRAVREIRR